MLLCSATSPARLTPSALGTAHSRCRALGQLVVLALALTAPVAAQNTPGASKDRPTVGLVLSGGSAKGLAHIGAIRVLEAVGLPVDVVTGTSMGSIVGGLYAAGYSVDQLDAMVSSQDWTALFSDAVDRRQVAPEMRFSEGAALLSLPIEDGTVGLPSGLISGQGIFDLLAGLTWSVHDVRDFAQLPRAFAAVVVDAETGAPVRLDGGHLPLVIRASMSLPGVFAPIEIDGRRYLDGGLARNLPAEDALALGADVLVCVDVSDSKQGEGEDSFFDIVVNAAFYQSDRGLAEQQALCDVLIKPDVTGLSAFAFDQGPAWVERGTAAAEAVRPALNALAARLGRPSLDQPGRPATATHYAEALVVRGVSPQATRLIRQRLDLAFPRSLSAAEVEEAVGRVYATGQFDLITYQVVEAEADGAAVRNGQPVSTLVLDVEPSVGDRAGFGFRYDTNYNAALLFSLTLSDLVRFGSTTQLDVRLGEQMQIQAGYYTRVGRDDPLSVAGQVGYSGVPIPVFEGFGRATSRGTLKEFAARTFAGPVLFDALLTGIGPTAAHVRAQPVVAPDSIEATTWTYASLSGFATADTRDRTAFPSRGFRLLALAEASPGLGASFEHLAADAEGWVPIRDRVTLGARAVVTRVWGDDVPLTKLTFIGGALVPVLLPGQLFPLHGAETLELAGPVGQLAAVSLQWEARPNVFFRAIANAGRAGEGWTLDPDAFRGGVGLSVGVATPIGPAEFILSGSALDDVPNIALTFGRFF
ncbi:MAG: patatin-like phospholipase family protein [Bacteroidota bacterium]